MRGVFFAFLMSRALAPEGPAVDVDACPGINVGALTSALSMELDAEPGVVSVDGGVVVVACTPEAVTVTVTTPGGERGRRIAGADRDALTERSLALAIAPLFNPTDADTVVPDIAPSTTSDAALDADVGAPPAVADDPVSAVEPEPERRDTPQLAGPPPGASQPEPISPPPRQVSSAMVVRPMVWIHDAAGLGGQLGYIAWPGRHLGISVTGTVRWGRAARSRGDIDAIVAGAGPGLAVQLGQRRIRFRGDLNVAAVYARLSGRNPSEGTQAFRTQRIALDIALSAGVQFSMRRLALVPQVVVGTTPGSPIGQVAGERDVSLLIPYGGVAVSFEPWLPRSRSVR